MPMQSHNCANGSEVSRDELFPFDVVEICDEKFIISRNWTGQFSILSGTSVTPCHGRYQGVLLVTSPTGGPFLNALEQDARLSHF